MAGQSDRLRISVGDLHFSARWEPAAPATIEAIRRMLPIDSKLNHSRWSGESTWIPLGDFRPGLDYENHTSHPAPGQLAIYPGGISECEIFFPYGGCTTACRITWRRRWRCRPSRRPPIRPLHFHWA